jgi:hypothetical protein
MLLRRFHFLLLVAVFLFPTLCLALSETVSRASDHFRSDLSFAGEAVPLSQEEVFESLDQELLLLSEAKARVWLTLRRAPRYLPIIEKALADSGAPLDFKYLPMALANLDPAFRAGNRRGFWRLTESEASQLGLRVNKLIDQRLDPQASSRAAGASLAALKGTYGSWTMALAAFLDPVALSQAVQEAGGERGYYRLYVPEALDKTVSQVIAGKILYSAPQVYGYQLSRPWPVLAKSQVQLSGGGEMRALAGQYNLDYKSFRDLNPHILTDSVPDGATLYIP